MWSFCHLKFALPILLRSGIQKSALDERFALKATADGPTASATRQHIEHGRILTLPVARGCAQTSKPCHFFR